jgi:hypothetical protein
LPELPSKVLAAVVITVMIFWGAFALGTVVGLFLFGIRLVNGWT